MNNYSHPENLFPDSPWHLNQRSVSSELAYGKYMTIFNAGVVALVASFEVFDLLPMFVSAIQESRANDIAGSGFSLAVVSGLAAISVGTFRESRRRWVQARFNQRFLEIATSSDIDSNFDK